MYLQTKTCASQELKLLGGGGAKGVKKIFIATLDYLDTQYMYMLPLYLWYRLTTRVGDLVDILSTGWENDAVSNIIALYADKES